MDIYNKLIPDLQNIVKGYTKGECCVCKENKSSGNMYIIHDNKLEQVDEFCELCAYLFNGIMLKNYGYMFSAFYKWYL